jgi:hypothetical protein
VRIAHAYYERLRTRVGSARRCVTAWPKSPPDHVWPMDVCRSVATPAWAERCAVRCRSGFELLRLPLTAEQLRWLMLAGTLAPLAHARIANPKKKTFALVNVLVRDGLKVQPRHGRIVLHATNKTVRRRPAELISRARRPS